VPTGCIRRSVLPVHPGRQRGHVAGNPGPHFYNYGRPASAFDVTQFHKLSLPHDLQWVFLAFFLGFAIKVPMFPFHTLRLTRTRLR
jgi:hypothetical protein